MDKESNPVAMCIIAICFVVIASMAIVSVLGGTYKYEQLDGRLVSSADKTEYGTAVIVDQYSSTQYLVVYTDNDIEVVQMLDHDGNPLTEG